MAGISGAIIGSAVIGAGSSLYGAKKQAKAAKKAGKKAAAALEAGYQRQAGLGKQTEEIGSKAQMMIADLFGIGTGSQEAAMGKFFTSPGYNFRVGEGVKALDQSAAARGGLFSGAQGKAVTRFGQDYGSNEYQNWLRGLMVQAGAGEESRMFSRGAAMTAAGGTAESAYNANMARGSAYAEGARGVNESIQGAMGNWIYAKERGLLKT